MRILMIEDDVTIAEAVRRGLTAEGFTVELASDGDDGLWMAMEGSWDAIILDLMLPGLGAWRSAGRCARLAAGRPS